MSDKTTNKEMLLTTLIRFNSVFLIWHKKYKVPHKTQQMTVMLLPMSQSRKDTAKHIIPEINILVQYKKERKKEKKNCMKS